jgi:two-component system, OmpR family, sensor histidine kinase BaeS
MMNNMMGHMMKNPSGINMDEYTENQYPLKVNDKVIGNITIGYLALLIYLLHQQLL